MLLRKTASSLMLPTMLSPLAKTLILGADKIPKVFVGISCLEEN